MKARLTHVKAHRPNILSKSVLRGPDGKILKSGGGLLIEGRATIREIGDLADLAGVLAALGPAEALIHGVPIGGDCRLMSRKAWEAAGRPAGSHPRDRKHFLWPDGPGVMMIDHDPVDGDVPLDRDALVALLRDVAPGLGEAPMLWWPSASSHIHDLETGEDLTGLRGQRLYLIVADAADIPRAGAALVDRLWAAGHGRVVASSAGTALERCPIDAMVWQPERLDFAAGAVCGPGLEQRRGAPVRVDGRDAPVDTRAALPEDTAIDNAATEARKAAKLEAMPHLAAARDRYIERTKREILDRLGRDDPETTALAEATARRAVEQSILGGDFRIEVETPAGGFEEVAVCRVLDNRARYHNRCTRDPLEPDYDGGRPTGKLFLADAHPTLHSFAHGGRSFRLRRAPWRIEVVAGRLAEATDRALARLAGDPGIFEHGGALVLVAAGRLRPLDEPALAHHLAGVTQFFRRKVVKDKHGQQEIVELDIDPPPQLLRQILSPGLARELNSLAAVITAPVLRPDGSVLQTPGYDPGTQLLFDPVEADFPEIPDTPSSAQIQAALSRLLDPFTTFAFVDRFARGAFLAALLTAILRPALPTAPGFAFDAPVQGSGKTLLARSVATLATGTQPQIWPHTVGRDDEEVRKRLFAALREGTATLVWDNVTGTFDSAAFAAALTAPTLRDRVLGRSETMEIPNRALILLTGNNLTLAGDLVRRILPCRIDPKSETPFDREFKLDPVAHVQANRPRLVVDGLTLVRARLASSAPKAPGRMASFEVWDDLVRQTVCWLVSRQPGLLGDPMDLVRKAQSQDPDREGLISLLDALEATFGDTCFSAGDISDRIRPHAAERPSSAEIGRLAETLHDIASGQTPISTRTIGRLLSARVGRIVSGRRLAATGGGNGNRYRVERLSPLDEPDRSGSASL